MLTLTASEARASGLFLLTAAALAAPSAALADTANATLSVEADVTANCTVSTSSLDFPDINPFSGSNVDGAGGITVTCTSGTGWTATAGVGSGSGASFASRRMTSGTDLLNYNLYTNAGRTTVWGDGSGTTGTITGTGTGAAQNATIYGRVPSGQSSVPPGNYTDSVSVTVTY